MNAASLVADAPEAAGRATVACAHCGLDVPPGMMNAGGGEQFCCGGCAAAYEAIHSCGLTEYYALRDSLGTREAVAAEGALAFPEFDDEEFVSRHCRGLPGGLMRADLLLEGVHCAACVWLLERLPRVVPGLVSLELDLGRRVATVTWDPSATALSAVAAALSRFGYTPHAVEPRAARAARRAEDHAALVRIGVAGACAGNVMLIALALYSGVLAPIDEPYLSLFRWLSAGIGVLCVAWPGRVFFQGALASWRARVWHLDTPVALALLTGSVAGVVSVARGGGEIYFDSLTMLVFLLLVGRWLQSRHQWAAHDAIELLFSMTPGRSHVVGEDGSVREVATGSVEEGTLVEIRANETVPVDGVIETGRTTADESVLTGESTPAVRGEGDAVAAGTVNLGTTIRVRTTAVGRDTRVGAMMAVIERLSRSRAPIIGSADRIAKPFVLGVLGLAAVTLAWHARSGAGPAFEHAVALLIVCCPCAVALATPMATSVAVARLAKRGVLVKGGDIFEPLAGAPTVVFDKTGTVTTGRFEIVRWAGDASLARTVARLERGVAHPIATALRADRDDALDEAADTEYRRGLGVVGSAGGARVAAGSAELMRSLDVCVPEWAIGEARMAAREAQTAVFVSRGGRVEAVAVLGDRVLAGTPEAVTRLREMGWSPRVLSGDAPQTARAVGDAVGITETEGGASPERKLARVRELAQAGPVVMVGDGVNDAAALAGATVGIAVSGGAEASMTAADVYLNRSGLAPLVDLAETSRRTVRVIRACLGVAIGYNALAGGIAVAGYVSPLAAAIVMPLSSLTVVSMALRAGREGGGA